jgi:hypothetical protein
MATPTFTTSSLQLGRRPTPVCTIVIFESKASPTTAERYAAAGVAAISVVTDGRLVMQEILVQLEEPAPALPDIPQYHEQPASDSQELRGSESDYEDDDDVEAGGNRYRYSSGESDDE